ncbi:MAG: hypothetical protein H0W50_11295, partial [Parachlamydiaceae bacterium]|nr:hypothetical protein [Parachlamydiaceae bacterium]
LSIHLPDFMLAEDANLLIPRFCKRLIECGYNSILIGSHHKCKVTSSPSTKINAADNLVAIFRQLNDHGIKILLKPNFAVNLEGPSTSPSPYPLKISLERSFDFLYNLFPRIEALFWESLYLSPAFRNEVLTIDASDATDAESALAEVQMLEKCIQGRSKLIFYMPSNHHDEALRQARWINKFIDDMGKNSIISFNAVSGGHFDDHCSDHPLWELLRISPDTSSTAFLPVINIGLIKQGEGLWPTTNFDLLDRFLPRCTRHRFEGIIGLISHIPESGSLLDCNLWVAGQTLWRYQPTSLLAETWFKAFRPTEDVQFTLKVMKIARTLSLDLSLLRSIAINPEAAPVTAEEAKIYGENILTSLRLLKLFYEKEKNAKRKTGVKLNGIKLNRGQINASSDSDANSRPSIKEYFTFFAHNVKQLLGSFLPAFNMPVSFIMGEEEYNISFWNHDLETPHRGHKNSIMEAIYLENRYL